MKKQQELDALPVYDGVTALPIENCHGHIFDFKCVPDKFIGIQRPLKSKKTLRRWAFVLDNLLPQANDKLSKFAHFMKAMNKTQEEIFLEWQRCYPIGTVFTCLTIDLSEMKAGDVQKHFMTQIDEILILKQKYPQNIRLQIMVDPRVPYIDELYNWMLVNREDIQGIKLYPLIGYTANDKRLYRFYELAKLCGWTVIIHGSPKNAVHYRERKTIDKLLPKQFPFYKKAVRLTNKCSNFTHPWHTEQAAKAFPSVNFDIAHFHSEYREYIVGMMRELPNIFTDISFTFNTKKEQVQLRSMIQKNPILWERLLFGDDMYMILTENEGNPFYMQMIESVGISIFNQIAFYNPMSFLKM